MNRRTLIISALLSGVAGHAMASPKGGSSTPAGGEMAMPLATATVLRPHGRRGIMSVESTLVFTDGALLERAKLSRPRLAAAFNEAVRGEALKLNSNAMPDLQSLTAALHQAANRVLGRAGARVLLGTVMVT